MAKLSVGDLAPDFELEGTDGTFRLSDQRGRRVILLFYPGDNTTVCTRQFCSYRDRAEDLGALDAVVVGISTRDVASKEDFTARHNLTVPLLADEDGAVAKAYGLRAPVVGMTKRAVVIVDEDGRVGHLHLNPMSLTFDTVDDLRAALEALPARAG